MLGAKRWLHASAWASLVLAVPAALLIVLEVVNSVNPFQTMFIAEFHVLNASGEPLRVWPAGRHQSTNRLLLLPQFMTKLPAFPSFRSGVLAIPDGGSSRVLYDWDDVGFSVLVVQRASGDVRVVDVDPERRGLECCRPPVTTSYTIPTIDDLRPPSAEEVRVTTETLVDQRRVALILAGPLVPGGMFWWSRRRRRREGEATRTA